MGIGRAAVFGIVGLLSGCANFDSAPSGELGVSHPFLARKDLKRTEITENSVKFLEKNLAITRHFIGLSSEEVAGIIENKREAIGKEEFVFLEVYRNKDFPEMNYNCLCAGVTGKYVRAYDFAYDGYVFEGDEIVDYFKLWQEGVLVNSFRGEDERDFNDKCLEKIKPYLPLLEAEIEGLVGSRDKATR